MIVLLHILGVISVYFVTEIVAPHLDEWLDETPDEKFSYKDRHTGLFTCEDNVTWVIAANLSSIEVRRTSSVYTIDSSSTQLAMQYDHLKDVKVAVYAWEKRVFWKFFYTQRHFIVMAEEVLLDEMIRIDMNGTLHYHPDGGFQVGFTVDDQGERDYFAYTSIYPYRCSELFPGIAHNRQTTINLKIEFANISYTIFTPNHNNEGQEVLFYPHMIMDNLGFIILKRFDTYTVTKNIRLIVHRIVNPHSTTRQVVPFINATQLVVARLQTLLNFTITELITIVMLPSVKERPMGFIRDYCIIDVTFLASTDPDRLIIQCLLQQYIIRGYTTRDQWAQRFLRGIRDYLPSLLFKTMHELDNDVLDFFSVRALQFFEERQVVKKRDWQRVDWKNYKVIAFLGMLRKQVQNSMDFKGLLWRFFDEYRFKQRSNMKGAVRRDAAIAQNLKEPNKVVEFFSLIGLFDQIKGQINYTETTVTLGQFLTGWLKEKGYPIIATRFSKDKNSGLASIEYEGHMPCRKCQLYFPLQVTINSRIQRESGGRLKRNAVTRETAKDGFWFLSHGSRRPPEHRNYNVVGWENRTSTYYYLDVNGTGIFRVFYRDENWKELLRHYAELPVLVRARLVSDIQYFHGLQRLSWKYVWTVLMRLKYEKSLRVWVSAEKLFLDLERTFRFTAVEKEFKELVWNVTENFYNCTTPPNPLAVKLACLAGMERCLKEATNRTRELISNNGEAFSRMEDVLCAGMRSMDEKFFQHLMRLVRRLDYRRRYQVIIAMTCFQKSKMLYGLLHQAFVQKTLVVPAQVRVMMLSNMFLSSNLGTEVALTFMYHNYREMGKHLTPEEMEQLMLVFAGYLKGRLQYRQVHSIMMLTGADSRVVLKRINDQMIWVKKNDIKMRRFLIRRQGRKLKRMIF